MLIKGATGELLTIIYKLPTSLYLRHKARQGLQLPKCSISHKICRWFCCCDLFVVVISLFCVDLSDLLGHILNDCLSDTGSIEEPGDRTAPCKTHINRPRQSPILSLILEMHYIKDVWFAVYPSGRFSVSIEYQSMNGSMIISRGIHQKQSMQYGEKIWM